MRMSRWEWLSRVFRPSAPPARRDRRGRPAKAAHKTWEFRVPGHGVHAVAAATKGEARAGLKAKLGLGRLPAGTAGGEGVAS